MLDLMHLAESVKDLPEKTNEMLRHLENIEALLERIAQSIENRASE